jgi:hypothetical protein
MKYTGKAGTKTRRGTSDDGNLSINSKLGDGVKRRRIRHAPRLLPRGSCVSMENMKVRIGYGLGVRTALNDTGFLEVVDTLE